MLRGRRVIVLPVVLLIAGLAGLAGVHGMTALDVGLIGLSTVIAAAIGLAQGAYMQLEERSGGLWGRMPGRSMWLWGALVLSRIAVIALGALLGAKAASSMDVILIVLGVNRLAQGGIITLRARCLTGNGSLVALVLIGQRIPCFHRTTTRHRARFMTRP
jgi:hypothetical protein